MTGAMTALAVVALAAWVWLAVDHHGFWRSVPELRGAAGRPAPVSRVPVDVVVPARDEAESIAASLGSLLAQDYAGEMRIVMVDDGSSDGTLAIARSVAASVGPERLKVIAGVPAAPGWSGKLWALAQGIERAAEAGCEGGAGRAAAEYLLLTDADIVHAPGHLAALVGKAEAERLDLVSEMVALRCQSLAERTLVPAFVFFFQLLYPFAAVNDTDRRIAAAAGGTILLRRSALGRIGGLATIRSALIDDVALARAVKPAGRIWLGHTRLARSLRAYPQFADIWRMIARTAFVQLRYSPVLLAATLLGMGLLFLLPPLAGVFGTGVGRWAGLAAWALAALLYLPTIRRYGRSPLWAPFLPLVAGFYLAATIGSAFDHWHGRGAIWKGRAYDGART